MKKIKQLLLSLALVSGCNAPVFAYSLGEFLGDVDKQVDFTLLDDIHAAYFYDGKNGGSSVGVVSHALTFCKYFHGDVGYSTGYDDKERGTFKYGVSLNGGKVLIDSFPDTVSGFRAFLPASADRLLGSLFIGPFVTKDATQDEISGGFYAGLKIRWF